MFNELRYMNKKKGISAAIILFVVLVISVLWLLNIVSPEISVPFTVMILSLIGAGAAGNATVGAYEDNSKKITMIFGISTILLISFAMILAYSIFF